MIRAAAFSLFLLAIGAQAEECGVKALAPFAGSWVTGEGWIVTFDHGGLGYRRPDMAKVAPLHLVATGKIEEPDDVSLDCQALDGAGAAKLLAEQEDYAVLMKGGPVYDQEQEAIARLRAALTRPPYPLVTVHGYESLTYYILTSKADLIGVSNGEALLSVESLKKKS